MQAYVQKTNSTMQQAAAEMAALRREAEGPSSSSDADDVQPEQSQAATAAVSDNGRIQDSSSGEVARTAGEASGAAQESSSEEAASGTGEEPSAAVAEGSASSGGCPYIGFSASSNFLDAQSLWDATMAFSIAEHFTQQQQSPLRQDIRAASSSSEPAAADVSEAGQSSTALAYSAHPSSNRHAAAGSDDRSASGAASGPGHAGSAAPLVVHVCGKFHSEGGYGITEHLAQYAPALRVLVVTFVPTWECVEVEEEAFRRDRLGLYGNFVVLTDLKLPRSFEVEHPL